MDDSDDYSLESLERCSYRFLQQTAKSMSLPSNVKKVYLIQLIHAKKCSSPQEVQNLIRKVRLERQHLAMVRKRANNKKKYAQQIAEISSTSTSKSPPITATPKRISQIMIRYSPDRYSPPKRNYRPKTYEPHTNTLRASDRVLRSFRGLKNPNYVMNNTMIGIYKSSSSEESVKSIGRVTKVSQVDKYQQVDMTSLAKKRIVGWRNANEITAVKGWKHSEIVQTQRHRTLDMSPQPVKPLRRLSGIYPLNENPKKSNVPNVSIRRSDGTLCKLNAYIQKPVQTYGRRQDREIQSMINIDTESNTTASTLSVDNFGNAPISGMLNMSMENSTFEQIPEDTDMSYKENEDYTVYYHKKIRAEQVRSLRSREMAKYAGTECRLPKINHVFSNFSNVYPREVTQPIYVQVPSEPEIAPTPPLLFPELNNYQTTMLESLFNIKNMFIVNQPLLQVATTTNTHCVYSTPVITTAKAQPTASVSSLYNIALSQDNSNYCMEDARVHDFFKNFRSDDDLSEATLAIRQTSSSDESLQSQDLGANVTIPEMVEDALELISQDGDYMERMGMDIRMQCILCEWAGPKIILEYHIRKEHAQQLVASERGEWSCALPLGALARAGLARVLRRAHALYVLRACYRDPACFRAELKVLSSEDDTPVTGSITTYNKVNGEPFTWKGIIEQLSPNLLFDEDNCLKLELSKLNLLPNSANLKLVNRELVVRSPTKVVVGQPELDNIHITLTVKVFD